MKTYTPPVKDIIFLLKALDYEGTVQSMPGFEDFDLEISESILDQIGQFAVNELVPLNEVGDRQGVTYRPDDHGVETAPGFKEAYAKYVETGFIALCEDPDYGGMGAPYTLSLLANEIILAANKSFSMCQGLTQHLLHALSAFGTQWQKDTFLSRLTTGEWSGTMALTEPQCGTDLGLITTRAEPSADGETYQITGNKIWISFGEHDMAENIVHLVLARIVGGPEGIRGISAFLVPKVNLDGSPNGVTCGGLEHKMGINASPTCVMNFEDATGYLVGEPHKGMRSMFVMMNAARLAVGAEGHALGEIAYQSALSFARDRRQSRALDPALRDADHKADTILVHPDIRRMLLNIKSTNEGLRALSAYIAMHYDIAHHHPDEAVRQRADDLVALLTPIMKSYGSERGFANTSEAMQITGGAGYTTDWPIEQYLRDARIAMIYEGTNHIQALDLVGRKLPSNNGRSLTVFLEEVAAFQAAAEGDDRLAPFSEALGAEARRLSKITRELGAASQKDRSLVGAVASSYLNLFAIVSLTLMWCRQVQHAVTLPDDDYAQAKIKTARYFIDIVLPEADTYARQVRAGASVMMDFPDAML
ncbi:MAG: alkylation response protein AidB-like acyl-CoA dehydrogenase [Myxococcota bacterium]|jgi:alkylation response protein AidB-like acyl-CoA dehydrogenase